MSGTKRLVFFLSIIVIRFLCGSASGIEIYVTAETLGGTYPLGKVTINGSNVNYAEIAPIDPTNQEAFDNLTWSNAANAFYSVSTTPKLTLIGTAGDIQGTPQNTSSLIIGLAIDHSNDTLYAYRQTDDTFGTIDKSTGTYSSIGSSGIAAGGVAGQMAYTKGKIYMSTLNGTTGTFGMIDKSSGAFSTINTGDVYGELMLASDGVSLYGIKSQGFQVYQIDPTNGNTTFIGAPPVPETANVWRFYGAAIVPEPGTYVLAGIAASVMTFAGRRKLRRSAA